MPSIRRSIVSPHQETWVLVTGKAAKRTAEPTGAAVGGEPILASAVMRIFPKTLRFYSIAVAGDCRGKGYGQLMLDHMIARARKLGKTTASLEADAANPALLRWYGNNGFEITKRLPDYYGKRQDAVRMHLRL